MTPRRSLTPSASRGASDTAASRGAPDPAQSAPSTKALGRPLLLCLGALLAALALGACGSQGIKLAKSNPDYSGAKIFLEHCSGCHTLGVVGAEGSATSILDRVKTNAPNFDYRKETIAQVLYALRNGGFSGEIMPQNVVVGKEAQEVATFLSKYSGLEKPKELGEAELGSESEEASTGSSAVIKEEEAKTGANGVKAGGATKKSSKTGAKGAGSGETKKSRK